MVIKQFIEKAIEGGWRPHAAILFPPGTKWSAELVLKNYYHQPTFLLFPEAWKAVGKVEGWSTKVTADAFGNTIREQYLRNMHRMLDALAEGKTIEQYLATL